MSAADVSQLPGLPRDAEGPIFREPWEAQAFALTLALYEKRAFTWSEWATALADEIKRAQAAGDPDTGATYYHHWIDALESLVVAKGLTTARLLHDTAHAWEDAARATPHGQPIELKVVQR